MAKEKKTVIEGEVLDSQNHHSPCSEQAIRYEYDGSDQK